MFLLSSEAATRGALCKKRSLEFHKIHRKTPVPESLFNKAAGLWHRSFPVNFAKFHRAPCFTEHLRLLLLNIG